MPDSHSHLKVLNLCRWYPNRYDPMPGLFIRRHAEAVALYTDVSVVYTHVVSQDKAGQNYEIEIEEKNGVRAAKVYYREPGVKFPLWYQAAKALRFFKANRLGIKAVSDSAKSFDLIHVHVLTRLGMMALYFKWRYGIPYVITEHWTRYLDLTRGFKGFFRKWMTRMVVKQAATVTTVSKDLMTAMQSHGLRNKAYRLIYNVVDPVFFETSLRKKNDVNKEFIHVSCFTDEQKNIAGLLRVVKYLSEKRSDFHFTFVGDGDDFGKMKKEAAKLKIPEQRITFTGLLEGKSLAETMARADALVLFSNYENMPVVINESLVLGLPVISTDVGGISEIVNDRNGFLFPKGDEKGLAKALNGFLDHELTFDSDKIRKEAREKFSQKAIGNELLKIYRMAIDKSLP